MIKIEGLTIIFKTFEIINLDIEIEEGSFHFLLGPSGGGKTLILESIIGLNKPRKGKICINGKEVQDESPEKREISYVPQDLALFPHLNVMENILFGIKAKKFLLKDYEDYIHDLISVTKIGHLLTRYPSNLSGGEKKRVALLRALAPKPKLLLLDEPLSGLDPFIKFEIIHLLKTIHQSFRPTILFVTHDFEDAYILGDKITIFMDGKVEQVGQRDDVFLKPKSEKVAKFLGLKNIYRARIDEREELNRRLILNLNGLRLSVPIDSQAKLDLRDDVNLFIRPEEVMIIREGKPIKDSLKRNIFEGKILDITDRGIYHTVQFQTDVGKITFEISIPNYAYRNLNLFVGKKARVALRDESLWLME